MGDGWKYFFRFTFFDPFYIFFFRDFFLALACFSVMLLIFILYFLSSNESSMSPFKFQRKRKINRMLCRICIFRFSLIANKNAVIHNHKPAPFISPFLFCTSQEPRFDHLPDLQNGSSAKTLQFPLCEFNLLFYHLHQLALFFT